VHVGEDAPSDAFLRGEAREALRVGPVVRDPALPVDEDDAVGALLHHGAQAALALAQAVLALLHRLFHLGPPNRGADPASHALEGEAGGRWDTGVEPRGDVEAGHRPAPADTGITATDFRPSRLRGASRTPGPESSSSVKNGRPSRTTRACGLPASRRPTARTKSAERFSCTTSSAEPSSATWYTPPQSMPDRARAAERQCCKASRRVVAVPRASPRSRSISRARAARWRSVTSRAASSSEVLPARAGASPFASPARSSAVESKASVG